MIMLQHAFRIAAPRGKIHLALTDLEGERVSALLSAPAREFGIQMIDLPGCYA
ncbi:hypothetical protein [Phytohalomonas tamaricis]|uniref:hypothetical protein n=1 Tax=Phytohalomonas tamaricis TaxID=2081032 RepID=UPI00131A2E29|nr:hypothetical protein [Phytohalomonas tamaricis]